MRSWPSSTWIFYRGRIRWQSPDTNKSYRPFCKIRVHPRPGPEGVDLWGLLDTGADHLMLHDSVASLLKFDLRNSAVTQVGLASGQTMMAHEAKVEISIRNKRVQVTALFGPGKETLIGRVAILKAMDFGIDMRGWLYR